MQATKMIADQTQYPAPETDVQDAEVMGFSRCIALPVANQERLFRIVTDSGRCVEDLPDTHYYYG